VDGKAGAFRRPSSGSARCRIQDPNPQSGDTSARRGNPGGTATSVTSIDCISELHQPTSYLAEKDEASEDGSGLPHLHEGEQVHALILRLLQQSMDPPVVSLHGSERPQMPQHCSAHAWNPCTLITL